MSLSPGQRPGSGGSQDGLPYRFSRSAAKRRWPRRHPAWSALIAIAGLLIIVAATVNAEPTKASNITTAAALHPTAAATAGRSSLTCQAQATSRQPRDHTTVTIKVHTVAQAKVTVTSRLASLRNKHLAGSANAMGIWALRVRVGDATPGARVIVAVRVSRHGSTGRCQASFRPRAAAVPVAGAPATASSCTPLSAEGTCYEPGEYCRDDDHGASGIAGDGESIVCEDNDGWRWEAA